MITSKHGFLGALALWIAFLFSVPHAFPHEIPADIYATVFVKQEPQRLRVLVRVPLAVVRDFVYPEQEDGYLDFQQLAPQLSSLARQWIVQDLHLFRESALMAPPEIAATQLSLVSDRSFSRFDTAIAHVNAELPGNDVKVVWNQLWLDVLLHYPLDAAADAQLSRFSIRTGFERLAMRVAVAVRLLPLQADERTYLLHMEGGSGDVDALPLDPRWHQAAGRFLAMGFHHILGGIDHLLFLCCLVIPLRRLKPLIVVVTAFTVAHSITLLAAASGYVPDGGWFPPLVETLIAITIVLMALGNIVGAAAGTPLNPKGRLPADAGAGRWKLAFAFGFIHGFGFSFALSESLQFAGGHLASSLLAFNVGVELGQLAVLLLLAPALSLLFRTLIPEGIGVIILSALIAHTGWHWMLERGDVLQVFVAPLLADTPPEASSMLYATFVASALIAAFLLLRTSLRRERNHPPY